MPIQNIPGIQRITKQTEPDIAKAFLRTIQLVKDNNRQLLLSYWVRIA
jgi:hypothetical protein